MNRNKALTRTLLSLTIASLLSACGSQSVQTNSSDAVLSSPTPVSESDGQRLEEVTVTGSRVGRSDDRQAANASTISHAEAAAPQSSAIGVYSTGSRIARGAGFPSVASDLWQPAPAPSTENYADLVDNGIYRVSAEPVSTFSIDVDTGSYSNVRRFLNNGQLPPADAVRAEELINYFSYDYPATTDGTPFSVFTEVAASPWQAGKHLVHIGIQAVEPDATAEVHSNLVFLIDVSGSMNAPDKLELLKTSLKMLTRQLSDDDSIAIVVYAGASGVVLPPTPGNATAAIAHALDQLVAGGSTNGAAGIQLAYNLAEQQFIEGGINRVLLATDGDFNVGMTDFDELKKLVSAKRKTGISLTTLGFGEGNYNDHLMEQLADAGNGNHAYIDTINEARKALVDERASTLQTVAKDVKIQIEFNPAVVSEYRLVGYENRVLAQADFNNDNVDAGEIGAGHSVTALYEVVLVGSAAGSVDALRYAAASPNPASERQAGADELAFLKLRYKDPDGNVSRLVERPLLAADIAADLATTSSEYRFSAAVAGFAQLLRDSAALGSFGYADVLALATTAGSDDAFGYRSEFINLVKTAQVLDIN